MKKAVIFDLDGTLIDSIDDLADTTNSALENWGFPIHSSESYKYYVGDGLDILLKRAAPPGTPDNILKQMIDYAAKEYSVHWARKTKPYEGIEGMLKSMEERGVSMAVLTNKRETFAKEIVKYFFPDISFTLIVGSAPGVTVKPKPDAALKIADTMGLAPQMIFFVGDTMVDMQTATNANMIPVGVLWGFRTENELLDSGARIIVKNPSELTEYTVDDIYMLNKNLFSME